MSAIRDRFVAAVIACGIKPRFEPGVRIASEPGVIAYESKPRELVIGRWESLPPPIQGFFDQWAAHDMPGKSGAILFDTLFNGFLVGHELGHWLADASGRLDKLDHYEAEIEANEFAIAFASLPPSSGAQAGEMVSRFSFLSTLPDTVPTGVDKRAYFNANYESLSTANPIAYNWYQGLFMREAWARHTHTDFCRLVSQKPG